jgi:hypothetical protein
MVENIIVAKLHANIVIIGSAFCSPQVGHCMLFKAVLNCNRTLLPANFILTSLPPASESINLHHPDLD